jgi:hypothetical protein
MNGQQGSVLGIGILVILLGFFLAWRGTKGDLKFKLPGGFEVSTTLPGAGLIVLGVLLVWPARDALGNEKNTTSPPPVPCTINGAAYNEDNGAPFAGIAVGSVPAGSGYSDEEAFDSLATAGQDGRFTVQCADVGAGAPADSGPFEIALETSAWRGCIYVSGQRITNDQARDNVNIYASDQVMRTIGITHGLPEHDNCVPPGG